MIVSRWLRWGAAVGVALSLAALPAQTTMADGGHEAARACQTLSGALTLAPGLTAYPGVAAQALGCGLPSSTAVAAPACTALIAAADFDHALRGENHPNVRAAYRACLSGAQTPGPAPTGGGGSTVVPAGGSSGAPTATFQDLAGYAWAQSAVTALAQLGILRGTGAGLFDPAGQLTRAQFAALMVRMFHLSVPAQPTAFVDVPQSDWAYADIIAAAPYMGRFQVPGGVAFEPTLPETRIDVAATVGAILVAEGVAQLPSAAQAAAVWNSFSDGAMVPGGLSQDAAVAVDLNLMKGLPGGSFGVAQPLDRAQAAVLLDRVLGVSETMAPGAVTVAGSVYGSVYGGGGTSANFLLP